MYAGSDRVSSMVKYTVHMYRFICMIYLYVHSHGDEIQHVLINEIDVEKEHGNTTEQVIHKLVAAPVVGYSRNSPHIAECFGPYMNSKVRNYGLLTATITLSCHNHYRVPKSGLSVSFFHSQLNIW